MKFCAPVNRRTAAAKGLIAAILLLLAGPVPAAELKMHPVDEAAQDPEFLAFRNALLDAVVRGDIDEVVSRAAPDIKLSFGGSYGRETFRAWLTESQGDDLDADSYRMELERALRLGGVFLDNRNFCTPYVACREVPGCAECNPFETLFVVSDAAKAYAAADEGANVVAELSYDVLPILEASPTWYKVRLPGGGEGYVIGPDFRMSIDYRGFFAKRDDVWQLDMFLAGD